MNKKNKNAGKPQIIKYWKTINKLILLVKGELGMYHSNFRKFDICIKKLNIVKMNI